MLRSQVFRKLLIGCWLSVVCAGWHGAEAGSADPHWIALSDLTDLSEWSGSTVEAAEGPGGTDAICIPLGRGGRFRIELETFAGLAVDVSEYDILKFDYTVTGGTVIAGPILRQWPFVGGYVAEYSSSIAVPPKTPEWTSRTLNLLHGIEDARSGFNRAEPLFGFSGSGMAEQDDLRIYLANIRLARRLIRVECIEDSFLHFGVRDDSPDGTVRFRYDLVTHNRTDVDQTVLLEVSTSALTYFQAAYDPEPAVLAAGASRAFPVTLTLPGTARRPLNPLYSERAAVRLSVVGTEESAYDLQLIAAVPFTPNPPPRFLANHQRFEQMRQWTSNWGWAKQAAEGYLQRANRALLLPTDFAAVDLRDEQPGDRICPDCGDETELYEIQEPLCQMRYQCLRCGKLLSPKLGNEYAEAGSGWRPDGSHDTERFPRPGYTIAIGWGGTVVDLGIAYRLTGEIRYAEKIADAIRGAIKVVPDYPFWWWPSHYPVLDAMMSIRLTSRPGVYAEGWFAANMSQALDMIWDAGVLSEDERRVFIEEVLMPAALQRCRMRNYRYGSFAREVGYAAILADNAAMLAYAIDDPMMGFRSKVREQILDDGMHDSAPQYQEANMMGLLPLARVYHHAGIDVYPPALERFFTTWAQWTDPNGFTPNMGDSTAARAVDSIAFFEEGFGLFGHPEIAIPIQNRLYSAWQSSRNLERWEDLSRSRHHHGHTTLLVGAENIPRANHELPRLSVNLDHYGLLIFNHGREDHRLWAAIPYGRAWGHGHNDKLHLEWWALGQKMSRKAGGYATAPGLTYWKHAAAHNTLVVDQRDQMNVPGEVLQWIGDGPVQGAVVRHADAYPGTVLHRTVVLYDGMIFLYDTFDSETERTYDVLYRNAGALQSGLPLEPVDGAMGDETGSYGVEGYDWQRDDGLIPTGYAVFQNLRRSPVERMWQVSWDGLREWRSRFDAREERHDGQVRMTQFMLSGAGEAWVVDAPFDWGWRSKYADADAVLRRDPPEAQPNKGGILWGPVTIGRQTGRVAAFLTILEPYRGETPRLSFQDVSEVSMDGQWLPPEQAVMLEYQADGRHHQLMFSTVPGRKTFGQYVSKNLFDARYFGDL